MNSRERVLAAVNRQPLDRIPVDIWCTPEIYTMLAEHFKVDNPHQLYKTMGIDKLDWVNVPYVGALRPAEAEGQSSTLWGSLVKGIQAGEAQYAEQAGPALQGLDDISDLDRFEWWPDPDKFDYAAADAVTRAAHKEFATLGPWVSFFEIYCGMRGLEQAMMDVYINPDYVNATLDRIEHIQTELLKRYYTRTGECVDFAFISDDMGSQQAMLFGLETWEALIAPRLKRWCDMIHGFGVKVLYHSDGAVGALIPRLIECGIDVLNPIQHICPTMDCAELKALHGDKVIFHGGIENQSVLPFGTADQVREETRHCLNTLGAGGGYICCSCHNIQPGTPLENILAYVDVVHTEGHLPLQLAAR